MTRQERITNIKQKYAELYAAAGESQLLKFDSLLENISRCEADLEDFETIVASDGLVKVHPDYPDIIKISKLSNEIIKTRASYSNMLTVAERYMGGAEQEIDDGLDDYE